MVEIVTKDTFKIGGKTLSLFQFLALRQRIGALRSITSNPNKQLRNTLNIAYAKFSDVVDRITADNVGGVILKSRGGTGFRADILEVDQDGNPIISEVKSISVLVNEEGQVTSASKIDLGLISVGSLQNISTRGLVADSSGIGQSVEPFALSGKTQENFFSALKRKSRRDRITYLNSLRNKNTPYGRAAKQIIENIETKSSKIYVSTPTPTGSSQIREIGWSWTDIVKNKKIVFASKNDGFTILIPSDEVIKALNSTNIIKNYKDLSVESLTEINKLLIESSFSADTFRQLEKIGINFEKAVTYDSGSVNIYKTNFKTRRLPQQKQETIGRFISKAQLTILVQRAMLQRMPRGPERGPPLSSRTLTYRTGRFLRSTQISLINYKNNVIQYFYDPIYRVHEDTSRDPRTLIESSIREVTQQRFGRQFNIIRG